MKIISHRETARINWVIRKPGWLNWFWEFLCERLSSFNPKYSGNIFYKYQSGFRNNHSTDLFLSFLNDKILKGFGNAIYTGMILIDLQKAYTLGSQFILWKCSFDICSLLYNFKQNLMQLFCVTCSLSFSFFEEFGYQAVQE